MNGDERVAGIVGAGEKLLQLEAAEVALDALDLCPHFVQGLGVILFVCHLVKHAEVLHACRQGVKGLDLVLQSRDFFDLGLRRVFVVPEILGRHFVLDPVQRSF